MQGSVVDFHEHERKLLRELRCLKCRTLLLMEYLFSGRLEIKCHKCGHVTRLTFKHKKNAIIKTAQRSKSLRKED